MRTTTRILLKKWWVGIRCEVFPIPLPLSLSLANTGARALHLREHSALVASHEAAPIDAPLLRPYSCETIHVFLGPLSHEESQHKETRPIRGAPIHLYASHLAFSAPINAVIWEGQVESGQLRCTYIYTCLFREVPPPPASLSLLSSVDAPTLFLYSALSR